MADDLPREGDVLSGPPSLPIEEVAVKSLLEVEAYVSTRAQRLLSKKKTIPAAERDAINMSLNLLGLALGEAVQHIESIDSSYRRARILFSLRTLIAATYRIAERGASNDVLDRVLKEKAERPLAARMKRFATAENRRDLIKSKVLECRAHNPRDKIGSLATRLLDEVNDLLKRSPAPGKPRAAETKMMKPVSWDTLKGDIKEILARGNEAPSKDSEQSAGNK
jgi:hypothetical protein